MNIELIEDAAASTVKLNSNDVFNQLLGDQKPYDIRSAYLDLIMYVNDEGTCEITVVALSDRWGISTRDVSQWINYFQENELITVEHKGLRLIIKIIIPEYIEEGV